MANYVFIATSLDGFIADEQGGVDWLTAIPDPDDGSDYGWAEHIARIDAILMGRKSFETVLGFGQWHYQKPVVVLSRSMRVIPAEYADRASLASGTPREVVMELAGRGFGNLYIDGGDVIRQFLAAGLVDEMTISIVPVLLGRGIPLFGEDVPAGSLELKSSTAYANGIVSNHYIVRRPSAS
ncbi:MAG: dihydrofolate reductase [Planctomycetales bacterium]|nr:dihydrofolate reductase [bacterium]UNM07496.1 MAG: dihydrofolate reductase [Planctomycetales bacterium]